MPQLRNVTIALCCALILFFGGLWLGGHPTSLPGPLRDAFVENDRALRAELIDVIQDNFYKKVSRKKLDDASLKGMVRSLNDRFSHYLTPAETRQFRESVEGSFEGVGMTVDQDKRGLRVLNVFKDTPASRAKIKQGDVVTAVNGKSLQGVDSDVSVARIKGRAGTSVRLEVLDPATKRRRSVRVERAKIDVPVARGRLRKQDGRTLGVVQLTTFSSGAHGELRREVDKVLKRGATGIVLDLRGNGGGLLQEAVLVSSQFIENGEIVSTRGRRKPERSFGAIGDAIDSKVPMVVLVDGGSASASEIVTGALRDRHRATVVGTRTFGKGVFQEVEPLSNGGVLDLTVGSYYLPSGENISHKGIRPKVRARDNPRTRRDEALPIALRTLAAKATG
jgi:carboxyl-terminal processing protease